MIATKYNNDTPQLGIAMQRPLCSYPQIAAYKGSGDPNLATSFRCIADEDERHQSEAGAAIYGP